MRQEKYVKYHYGSTYAWTEREVKEDLEFDRYIYKHTLISLLRTLESTQFFGKDMAKAIREIKFTHTTST